MKKRFTEEQIIGFLREAEAGLPVAELCRRHGFSEASYYLWRSKFGGRRDHCDLNYLLREAAMLRLRPGATPPASAACPLRRPDPLRGGVGSFAACFVEPVAL